MRRICAARRKDGTPCKGTPLKGSDKCRMHAGRKAAVVKLEYEAKQQLARLDVPAVADPLTELARIAGQVIAWKDRIAEKVNELTELRYDGDNAGEQLRAEVALLERAFDRCEKFLTAMARLNIDERLAAIAEAQAQLVMDAIRAGLEAANATPEQRRLALAAARERLAA